MIWIVILCVSVVMTVLFSIRWYQYTVYKEKVAQARKYVEEYRIQRDDFYLMPDGSILRFCCEPGDMYVAYMVTDGKIATIWETRFLYGGTPLHLANRFNDDTELMEKYQLARRRFASQRDVYGGASPIADKKALSPLEKLLQKKAQ